MSALESGAERFSAICSHKLVRSGGLTRSLGIPNPYHYWFVCQTVDANWPAIEEHMSISPYSCSRLRIGGDRATKSVRELSEKAEIRAEIRRANRYMLRADISRFYPSIYTHTIPWGVMGKPDAKKAYRSRTLNGTWFDELDKRSQKTNSNQTVGVPIGPDTSHIIAEIILARIDSELASRLKNIRGFRFIDDYELCAYSRGEIETALSKFQQLLNDYELDLNTAKTAIVELPVELDTHWTSDLRTFHFRGDSENSQRHDLTQYFNLAFAFHRAHPGENVLKYAIARLRSIEVNRACFSYFENILAHCVTIEPACIPQVCNEIAHYRAQSCPVHKRIWTDCLNKVITHSVPLGKSSEAAWAMWLMKVTETRLRAKTAQTVCATDDSIVALMALGLASVGLADKHHLENLRRYREPAELWGRHWLLAYEGNHRNLLGRGGRARLSKYTFFEFLHAEGVSFFDINTPPPRPTREPLSARSGGGGAGY